jgi:uncharacterized protein YjbI with pentapeptide repeats
MPQRSVPFVHLRLNKTNQFNRKKVYLSGTDKRGSYFENAAVYSKYEFDVQGCVFYKCFFINLDIPKGSVAVDSTHINYDLVLEQAISP